MIGLLSMLKLIFVCLLLNDLKTINCAEIGGLLTIAWNNDVYVLCAMEEKEDTKFYLTTVESFDIDYHKCMETSFFDFIIDTQSDEEQYFIFNPKFESYLYIDMQTSLIHFTYVISFWLSFFLFFLFAIANSRKNKKFKKKHKKKTKNKKKVQKKKMFFFIAILRNPKQNVWMIKFQFQSKKKSDKKRKEI